VRIARPAIRTLLTQLDPAHYTHWISAAAACWMLGFAVLGWRYIPFFLQPRVDGKAH